VGAFARHADRRAHPAGPLALAVEHLVGGGGATLRTLRTSSVAGENRVAVTVEARPGRGGTLAVTKLLAYCTSLDHPEGALMDRAREAIEAVPAGGFEDLVAEQRDVLDRFWASSDVELDGDGALQQGVRFNLFSLFQSAGRDGRTSLAAKGLTGRATRATTSGTPRSSPCRSSPTPNPRSPARCSATGAGPSTGPGRARPR
jgi:trehalose/maltose hydrolase-like predicted phosphorylase